QINSTAGRNNYPLTGSLMHFPNTVITDRLVAPGDWFTLEVVADGYHFVIKTNGKKTVDFIEPDRKYHSGHLAVQVLDPPTVIEFRKIEIKELPPTKPEAPPAAGAPAEDKGWVKLFNSKDLTGWTTLDGKPAGWEVKDGYLEVVPGKKDIRTKEDFGPDFKL